MAVSQQTATAGAHRERIADYEFVKFLGEGNYGAFYLARPPARLQTQAEHVAVKVLIGAVEGEALRRMSNELQVFAAVQSPHLVTLIDAGQEGTTCFYAMDYYPDGSLGSPARPLDTPGVLRAVACAARGAHALHDAGIAHRDIKPENILLTADGARLSDLGLAQILAPGQTMTGMGPIGSVEFMDPSIITGGRASRATDVWALGATLHKALTGRSVYSDLPDRRDPLLLLRAVLKNPPAVDPDLPAVHASLVNGCIAADPADRFPTAEALAERLEAA